MLLVRHSSTPSSKLKNTTFNLAQKKPVRSFRERHEFRPGSTIHLRPDVGRAHLFDAATGLALRPFLNKYSQVQVHC
ncbi:MAG: hypothetical protein FJ167_08730, partial [Gammaproteobacteria bacterium]|nr:hypothetical protein [Gammaproteobacteria bacterium]